MIATLRKSTAVIAIAMAMVGGAKADPISGTVLMGGSVLLDTPSVNTATGVLSTFAFVAFATDDYASYIAPFSIATMASAWSFTSGPISSFWSVGGFTFDLDSSAIVTQGGGAVHVAGTGTVYGNGFDPTPGIWSFTTQDPGATHGSLNVFSFSASGSHPVPDSGSTMILIGAGLTVLGLASRRMRRA
jgi:hypothetical protein